MEPSNILPTPQAVEDLLADVRCEAELMDAYSVLVVQAMDDIPVYDEQRRAEAARKVLQDLYNFAQNIGRSYGRCDGWNAYQRYLDTRDRRFFEFAFAGPDKEA